MDELQKISENQYIQQNVIYRMTLTRQDHVKKTIFLLYIPSWQCSQVSPCQQASFHHPQGRARQNRFPLDGHAVLRQRLNEKITDNHLFQIPKYSKNVYFVILNGMIMQISRPIPIIGKVLTPMNGITALSEKFL